ncbi:hypothetical protein K431DRAFT_38555 [Polychaeton citri CBS 116435]|uniref:Secreted protein n=1 Tax=Polychaeton citri CBS 116435 TaxID=1314669 RepID=A0A9P4UQD6_9PEZI|nr:hypothetical protein K431DRAFT_38555 [Polychaeton citri CBS 116435]
MPSLPWLSFVLGFHALSISGHLTQAARKFLVREREREERGEGLASVRLQPVSQSSVRSRVGRVCCQLKLHYPPPSDSSTSTSIVCPVVNNAAARHSPETRGHPLCFQAACSSPDASSQAPGFPRALQVFCGFLFPTQLAFAVVCRPEKYSVP